MKQRETELDILRLAALVAVVFTHASGIPNGLSWLHTALLVFLQAAVTWHVPVFIMISGRFFLDPARDLSPAKIIKAIGRLCAAFLFWNLIYQSCYVLSGAYADLNWKGLLSQTLMGPYHFWYLFMLICMYAITPFLRKITEDKALMEYFIGLFLIFEFLTMYGPSLPFIGPTADQILTKANFHFALGYSGYYILGYYLRRYPLRGHREIGLYILGVCMLLLTGLATVWKTLQGAEGGEWFSKYLMPNVIIEAAAIYAFFVNRVSKLSISRRTTAVISRLAEYSFGAYLIHALILYLLAANMPTLAPGLDLVYALFLTCAISIGATALIRKIPYIGKKIT